MSNFDLLSPELQYHIVNSLGWKRLLPVQDDLIPDIMDGKNLIILAPTAGGKTEAAFFPLLSRMAVEDWQGMSVLYVCPLRALLNNLHDRVVKYTGFMGRRAGVWHGDISVSEKKAMLRDPPDILMTTPESLEGILISSNKDHRDLLSNIRAVVVDEIHSFAGDDRGWHLLFVLQRILNFSKHKSIQRLGLSATVGNPEYLMEWLESGDTKPHRIYNPTNQNFDSADVKIDFVGNLENAASIIFKMFRGEKCLVFIDSRAKAEELGKALRELETDVYVTHGSLSREQRLHSEQAFAERTNCVIVATSVLELGIDIGSLDRVVQIDSPSNVAAFLQRMGRTGRRADTQRNCLFLTLKRDAMLKTCALVELWRNGYIEPAIPPANPIHIAAQQMMALPLQNNGIGRKELVKQLEPQLKLANISSAQVDEILDCMLEKEILFEDTGIISMGRFGEDEFGRRHFIDLVSVFCTPPLFTIRHGRQDLGYVDPLTFSQKKEEPWCILLAGRSWQVNHVDWNRKLAYVEPSQADGKSRWLGIGPDMSYKLCQAYKTVLTGDFERPWWSKRVREKVEESRKEFYWISANDTILTRGAQNQVEWWTFAGTKGNSTIAAGLAKLLICDVSSDPFFIRIDNTLDLEEVREAINSLKNGDWEQIQPIVNSDAIEGLKFNACLSDDNARSVLQSRLKDSSTACSILKETIRLVSLDM